MLYFHLLWPEVKRVNESWINRVYADAVANDELEPEFTQLTSVVDKAKALDQCGIITLKEIK
jgi:hypothetical protein